MDTPFVYDKFVTGKNFIGRKSDCNVLKNLIDRGDNVCLYEPPKSGKMSLVQQVIFNMRLAGKQFSITQFNLYNIRSLEDFLIKFGAAAIRSVASTPAEYGEIIGSMLEGTHFVFDQERFSEKDEVLSLNWEPDRNDIRSILELPGKIALQKQVPMFVILEEFQNLMMLDEMVYESVFKELDQVFATADKSQPFLATYILTGSKVNAMKFIFEERKYFYRHVEHLPLSEVDSRDIIDHIVKGFLSSGKVIERDLVLGATRLFRCNLWYLNHFTAICDSLSKGYMNEGILMEALRIIISIHEPRFKAMTDDLTNHQLNLVRAILDGEKKFSSTEVIEKYAFNSSANVRRLKDALRKKEIITFDEKDEPVILDPLYEYWMEKHYLERR